MKRKATAIWQGNGLEGKGTLSSNNKFFDNTPFSAKTRFQNEDGKLGTNPEELIAAAHAACFDMQLSFMIAGAGFTADELHTDATVTIEQVGAGFVITNITLDLKGKVTGMAPEKFYELAKGAKEHCPVSNALRATPITLNMSFEG